MLTVWLYLIWERIGPARAVEAHGSAANTNFTVSGSKELGLDVNFKQLERSA